MNDLMDPRVGNERRKRLLEKVMQQMMARQGGARPSAPPLRSRSAGARGGARPTLPGLLRAPAPRLAAPSLVHADRVSSLGPGGAAPLSSGEPRPLERVGSFVGPQYPNGSDSIPWPGDVVGMPGAGDIVGGMIPLGGGIFLDPETGVIRGGGAVAPGQTARGRG